MENRTYGDLAVTVLDDNAALGQHAAANFAELVRAELSERDEIAVILATGNSQLSFITAVAERDDIEWSRITVVHMDEYIGMTEDHSASFRLWMKQNIVETVHPKVFHGVRGDHEPVEEEVERYERLLLELDPVICVMGIGENGHLAFNDPPADFHTAQLVHIVAMDEVSRIASGPGRTSRPSQKHRPTRSRCRSPRCSSRRTCWCYVPEARRRAAVKRALEGDISPESPALDLRTQSHAQLFLDSESAAELSVRV